MKFTTSSEEHYNTTTEKNIRPAFCTGRFATISSNFYNKTLAIRRLFMWLLFAVLSSIFAAATSILAKCGISGINSNLATAIRTFVVLAMSWIVVFVTKTDCTFSSISRKNWLFLILSGLSTGLSWLCYYRAIQVGKVSKVVAVDKFSIILTMIFAAVFLHEQFTVKSILGCLMIAAGTLLMVI